MKRTQRRSTFLVRLVNVIASVAMAVLLLFVAAFGIGPIPPLGPVLNPGTGIWANAQSAQLKASQTIHLVGVLREVDVVFGQNGMAHIHASTDEDLFWAIGYIHARFRLFQMDLMRRQTEGQLSEIFGRSTIDSDSFEKTIGLERTAQAELFEMPVQSPSRQILEAYSRGVNSYMKQAVQDHTLPLPFKLLNYTPRLWTPLDSLMVQGNVTQSLSFTEDVLTYTLLTKYLGYQRTMQWFPIIPADEQHPYDTGPYATSSLSQTLPHQSGVSSSTITNLLQRFEMLPSNAIHTFSNSNTWAVNGLKTANGKSLLAGDPHLSLTLPSIWYQLEAEGPHYYFNGVGIAGLPVILIGNNRHISWSETNVQNQATFFYHEQTDKAHPFQYYWQEAWHQMQKFSYTIHVKGSNDVHRDVYVTAHGPVMNIDILPEEVSNLPSETLSVYWTGQKPSLLLDSLLGIIQSGNYTQFRDALRQWGTPALNFSYADDQGNIGMISAGNYPILKSATPWLILSGTGGSDVVGSIPFDQVPQVYDPPSHFVFSANQRPVGKNYPYYLGTTLLEFDNGYRADEIYKELEGTHQLTISDMERLQNSSEDYLATLIVPKLINALKETSLSLGEQKALHLLETWNDVMDVNEAAPSIWWDFWQQYIVETFQPWWQAFHVPDSPFLNLSVRLGLGAPSQDLEFWTLHDLNNQAFSLPNGMKRNATQVMIQAFHTSVAKLGKAWGSDPAKWMWGKIHTPDIKSLLGYPSLSYGPRPLNGDYWTVNATSFPYGDGGPSYRFVMDWSTQQSYGVLPGGQDENPFSPWYQNQIENWWNGHYYSIDTLARMQSQAANMKWTFLP